MPARSRRRASTNVRIDGCGLSAVGARVHNLGSGHGHAERAAGPAGSRPESPRSSPDRGLDPRSTVRPSPTAAHRRVVATRLGLAVGSSLALLATAVEPLTSTNSRVSKPAWSAPTGERRLGSAAAQRSVQPFGSLRRLRAAVRHDASTSSRRCARRRGARIGLPGDHHPLFTCVFPTPRRPPGPSPESSRRCRSEALAGTWR